MSIIHSPLLLSLLGLVWMYLATGMLAVWHGVTSNIQEPKTISGILNTYFIDGMQPLTLCCLLCH